MRNLILIPIVLVLLASGSVQRTVQAAKPGLTTPASAVLVDRTIPGYGVHDLITSDGLGAYTNGVGGVACVVFTGSTGDVHCDLSASSNPIRVLNFDPSGYVPGSGTGTGPTAPFSSNSGFDIQAIAQMHVGDSKQTGGAFGVAGGMFQFVPNNNPATSPIRVERYGDNLWVASTDPGADVAQLLQAVSRRQSVIAGLYHLPFEITVSCPACVAP